MHLCTLTLLAGFQQKISNPNLVFSNFEKLVKAVHTFLFMIKYFRDNHIIEYDFFSHPANITTFTSMFTFLKITYL